MIGSCHSQPPVTDEETEDPGKLVSLNHLENCYYKAEMAVGVVFSKPFSFHWKVDSPMIKKKKTFHKPSYAVATLDV